MKGQVVTDSAVLQQHVPDFLWLLRDVDVEFIDEDDKDEERGNLQLNNIMLQKVY